MGYELNVRGLGVRFPAVVLIFLQSPDNVWDLRSYLFGRGGSLPGNKTAGA
jgi:hypothetical protein